MAPAELCAAFDILFGLLDYIDQGNDDVIFFADEGGAWQVDVAWAKVLPSCFRVLSATATGCLWPPARVRRPSSTKRSPESPTDTRVHKPEAASHE